MIQKVNLLFILGTFEGVRPSPRLSDLPPLWAEYWTNLQLDDASENSRCQAFCLRIWIVSWRTLRVRCPHKSHCFKTHGEQTQCLQNQWSGHWTRTRGRKWGGRFFMLLSFVLVGQTDAKTSGNKCRVQQYHRLILNVFLLSCFCFFKYWICFVLLHGYQELRKKYNTDDWEVFKNISSGGLFSFRALV